MAEFDGPVVRLRPKADAKSIRHGFPWLYDNDVVTDRRTKAIAPGSIALLEDGGREPLALIAFNAQSRLIGRVLDHDLSAAIDTDWFKNRLSIALELRDRVFDRPYYRWIHAEADGLPGLVIDRFNDAVVVQPNAAWVDGMLPELVSAIQSVAPEIKTIVKNASGRARRLEGLDDETEILTGSIDGPIPVPMNNATYMADLTGGQKTGLFYDQRPNHAFFANLARLFSHLFY